MILILFQHGIKELASANGCYSASPCMYMNKFKYKNYNALYKMIQNKTSQNNTIMTVITNNVSLIHKQKINDEYVTKIIKVKLIIYTCTICMLLIDMSM